MQTEPFCKKMKISTANGDVELRIISGLCTCFGDLKFAICTENYTVRKLMIKKLPVCLPKYCDLSLFFENNCNLKCSSGLEPCNSDKSIATIDCEKTKFFCFNFRKFTEVILEMLSCF